jgi:hypothetical protein
MSRVMAKVVLVILQEASPINSAWKLRSLQPSVSISLTEHGIVGLIIDFADGTLSFATIALALKVPRMADAKSQQLAVIIWGIVLFGVYSFLLSVFRMKNGGYPFFLPPF